MWNAQNLMRKENKHERQHRTDVSMAAVALAEDRGIRSYARVAGEWGYSNSGTQKISRVFFLFEASGRLSHCNILPKKDRSRKIHSSGSLHPRSRRYTAMKFSDKKIAELFQHNAIAVAFADGHLHPKGMGLAESGCRCEWIER